MFHWQAPRDYDAVRKAIEGVLDNDNYDDGSYGPVLVSGLICWICPPPLHGPVACMCLTLLMSPHRNRQSPHQVRLAWHAAGTYDKATGTGGSNGATMRFAPESEHGANAGLAVAR